MNPESPERRTPIAQRPWLLVLVTLVFAIAASAATAFVGPYLLQEFRVLVVAGETDLIIWAGEPYSDWQRTVTVTRADSPFLFWASVLQNVAMTIAFLSSSILSWLRLAMVAAFGFAAKPTGDLRCAMQWLTLLAVGSLFYVLAAIHALPILGSMVFG